MKAYINRMLFNTKLLRVGDLLIIDYLNDRPPRVGLPAVNTWTFDLSKNYNKYNHQHCVDEYRVIGLINQIKHSSSRNKVAALWDVLDWRPGHLWLPNIREFPEDPPPDFKNFSVKICRDQQIIEPELYQA